MNKDVYGFIESSCISVLLVNKNNGQITYANEAAAVLTGFRTEELVGLDARSLFQSKDQVRADSLLTILCRSAHQGQVRELNLVLVKNNKRPIEVNLTGSLIAIDGEPTVCLYIEDISELKKAEREKEQTLREMAQISKLADIGILSAGIAHELNNPLMIIQGFIDIIFRRIGAQAIGEDIYDYLNRIRKATERMSKITNMMRKNANDREVEWVVTDIIEILFNVVHLMEREFKQRGIHVEFRCEKPAIIKCDPGRVEQVIINVLTNALQALEESETADRRIVVTTSETKSETCLSIWNNGPEIPEEVQSKILLPFFTTKDVGRGTGLGLHLSHTIMEAHGGKLTFTSRAGSGTEFKLQFPRLKRIPQTYVNSKRRTLVVEDEDLVREVLVDKLSRAGFDVVEACNGVEALEILEAQKDIEVVFTDLLMPKMDGRELIRGIRARGDDTFVVVVTGHIKRPETDSELHLLGVNEYLTKPIDQDRFSKVVHAIAAKASRHSNGAA